MMKRTRTLILSLPFFLFLLLGCWGNEETFEVPTDLSSLTVEEAKVWFEANIALRAQQKLDGRNATTTFREPDWNFGKVIKNKGKEIVVVPLKFKEPNRFSKGSFGKILISKDDSGKMELQVLKATGDAAYMNIVNYKIGLGDFSGIVELQDWEGNFISGEYYKNGKVIGVLDVVKKNSNNVRTQGYWKTIYTDWYQQVCTPDGCSSWVYLDTTTRVVWVADGQDPSNFYGTYYYYSSGNGGGGGTGGGGGSHCYYPECSPEPIEPDYGNDVLVDIEVGRPDELSTNRLCGGYQFTQTGDGLTAEILGLAAPAWHTPSNRNLLAMWGAMCVTFGSSTIVTDASTGTQVFNSAWNQTMNDAEAWLNQQSEPTSVQLSYYILQRLRTKLEAFAEGYVELAGGPCAGSVASTWARYCN